MLVSKIFELNDTMLETASCQFHNAMAQIRALNTGMELNMVGLDEEKEVRDRQVVSPQDEDEL
ncbi:hypothetical protein A2U01_0099303 [Trifolium medium]|nr:hypothetical protein [Trifolium medium]